MATGAFGALMAIPAAIIPAFASSNGSPGVPAAVGSLTAGPLLSVCLTVTPKSALVAVNGTVILDLGPAGVARTCIVTPF